MSQSGVAQINVRVPRDLKATGDQGLQALGISPTDAIRRLWTRLSTHGEEFEHVRAFLLEEESDANTRETPFEQSELAQGWRMVDEIVVRLGIAAKPESVSWFSREDDELIAQALEDRMRGRGVM
jgi:hypothetical protein